MPRPKLDSAPSAPKPKRGPVSVPRPEVSVQKPAPKKYSLPSGFHTEAQDNARNVATTKKVTRAVTPLRAVAPHHLTISPQHQQQNAQQAWRAHVRATIRQHDQDPKGLHVAATLLNNEIAAAHDQNRLRNTALDGSQSPSHRLSAARELRNRYGLPMTTTQLTSPERLQRVNAFLKDTDRAIARENAGGGAGGVTPLAAATADFNPIHVSKFLHTVGQLSTAGADTVYHGIFGKKGWGGGFLPGEKVVGNTIKDALDMPAQSIVSLYDVGSAAWQAGLKAQGKGGGSYEPLKKIAQSTKHLLEHPTEHPLAAALVLKGGVGALDKGAGMAVRTATRGKVLGTGGRAPIKLYGEQEVNRRFATGAVSNATQRILDAKRPGAALYNKFSGSVKEARRELADAQATEQRARAAVPAEVKTPADVQAVRVHARAEARVEEAQGILKGRKVGKNQALPVMRDRYLTKRGDEAVAAAEDQRSATVIRARKELRASLPKDLRPALRPTIEGTIKSAKTAVADVQAELVRLKSEHDRMQQDGEARWRVRRNERQQHTFEKLLENKAFREDPQPVIDAADKFIATQRQMESGLAEHGLLDPVRALRSKLIPYAVREMGARYDQDSGTIRAEDGTPLSNEEILHDAQAKGVRFGADGTPQVGFISQRGDLGRLGDYFKDSTKQPSGYFQKRTGESALKGLHNLHFKMVEAQLTHSLNVLSQAEHANEILDRFGLKPKGDMAFTDHAVASNAAKAATDHTGMNWTVVRIGQAVGEQLKAIHEHIDPAAVDMLPDSAQLPGKPAWLVMPTTVAKRFQEHTNTLGSNTFQLGFQALTHAFRNTVLPLSPRWLAGNVVELVVRGAVEGTGPMAWTVGHTLLRRLKMQDEGAYNEFVARAQSGSLYASQVKQDHYLGIERWTDQGLATHFAKPLIYAFHHKLSPITHLSWAYNKYASAIKWITPRIEKEFQAAAIGKAALHEIRDMHGHWLNAVPHWSAAIDDVSHGLLNTNKQIQFGEYVDKVVGRYNKLSPAGRRIVSSYMPFAMWYANAVRFVFVTLPKDHPIIQGWIAAGYVDTEKKRLAEGKSLTATIPDGKKREPDFLQGTITLPGGSHLPLQHYTPFGAFSDVSSLQGLVLPQVNTLPLALAGKNWKLEDFKTSGADATSFQERLKLGLYSATEALLPGLAVARRLQEQGGSAYDDSTLLHPKTRPGSKVGYLGSQGSVRKVLDPFRSYPSSSATTGLSDAGKRLQAEGGSSSSNRFLSEPAAVPTLSAPKTKGNRFLEGG